ncbi:helix-turn-helix transcriptional regulator [Microbacterium hominis]|uniref:ArsR family transcriptional regulator n=3 Tax=Microbacteriaceae TaxID=85023 RepID=A0A2K9DJ03_9MICO|nr:ArsR family transcriptional regulator [Microbacterium hominis]QOC27046.1 helix-turn-helix transcriptional regulator [Microbacterium hominis]QRY39850.1 helix-turn-helix transcriptional regulator [Microbacterium hominis]QYF96618.1 helix-turn-helix domain-containing protein [Microbacterium sp. PAMC21962]
MRRMDDVSGRAAARALSSPLRMRILRLCRFDARTNKELADLLEANPGTMLHHVRTLVDAGFLQPQPARAGAQGAREVPYLATGRSWDAAMDDGVPIMMETVRQQVALADPETVQLAWLGLRLNAEAKDELDRRVTALLDEYKDRPPDVDGEPYSLVVITHPDLNPPPR